MENLFWISIFIILYTYVGYGFILKIWVTIKRKFQSKISTSPNKATTLPTVTLLIPAYNEEECIEEKILNTLCLNYPLEKLQIAIVADGSTDETVKKVKLFKNVTLFFEPERKGKIHAVNRVMPMINTDITVFTDANTFLNEHAINEIVAKFEDKKVGLVSGEKIVKTGLKDDAAASGEGIYWKYESLLKKWDAEVNTIVGAAGELLAIRTALYNPLEENVIIEDFVMSLRIAAQGYKVEYAPNARAEEYSSENISEEMKRKIRISAGGIQAIVLLKQLLNPFKFGLLTFQYVSHRVLRWTAAPFALLIVMFTNIVLVFNGNTNFGLILILQIIFYLFAFLGFIFQHNAIKVKVFFIPYYFTMMNTAVWFGWLRAATQNQTVIWDKSKRRHVIERS